MSIQLTVNNIPFDYPNPGEQAPWGEGATGWATEVTRVLNSLKGNSDILETGANIANNITSAQDVTDFKFDPGTVRSFAVRGNITRLYDTNSVYEEFVLVGVKDATGWTLQQDGVGNSGITFSITPAGQVQYISSNLSYTSTYSGLIKFRGIGILNS